MTDRAGPQHRAGPAEHDRPSPAQAAQRNYLQALHVAVAEKGVYVADVLVEPGERLRYTYDFGDAAFDLGSVNARLHGS